ncbi:MAG: hypothetical protein ACREYE_13350, partial [Gammaproteobacteria bacterium]
VWGELAGFARARRHSTRACLTGAGIPSRRLIAANIENSQPLRRLMPSWCERSTAALKGNQRCITSTPGTRDPERSRFFPSSEISR